MTCPTLAVSVGVIPGLGLRVLGRRCVTGECCDSPGPAHALFPPLSALAGGRSQLHVTVLGARPASVPLDRDEAGADGPGWYGTLPTGEAVAVPDGTAAPTVAGAFGTIVEFNADPLFLIARYRLPAGVTELAITR